jgi:hypothetical protein
VITKEQALTANEFHILECKKLIGPRGGVKIIQEIWRRNGKTKTWVRDQDRFRIPIKRGLKTYGYITTEQLCYNPNLAHVAEDCPLNQY